MRRKIKAYDITIVADDDKNDTVTFTVLAKSMRAAIKSMRGAFFMYGMHYLKGRKTPKSNQRKG